MSTQGLLVPRVLIFHPALAPYRIDLFNALAQRCHARVVFLNRDVSYQSYDQAQLRSALSVEFDFLKRGVGLAGRDIRLGIWSELASFNPDVVVTHEFSATTLSIVARRAFGSKIAHVVWTADNPRVISAEHKLRRIARRIALPHLDGLIVYAEETASFYRSAFGTAQPIGLCPNAQSEHAVRLKLKQALPLTRELVKQYALDGRKVILYVGRLAAVKRLDRLINAFADEFPDRSDVSLVMVGDGPERASLTAQVTALGLEDRTIFAGHVEGERLYAFFNCGSVFALPSEFEPWGAVVNEALLAGIPVICSDRAGARVLVENGRNGEVVDPSDGRQLALALRQWFHRASPVTEAHLRVRPSLMLQGFQAAVDGFCGLLDEAIVRRKSRARRFNA